MSHPAEFTKATHLTFCTLQSLVLTQAYHLQLKILFLSQTPYREET